MTDQILTDYVYNLLNSVYNFLDIIEDKTPAKLVINKHVFEIASNLEEIKNHLAQQERLYRMIDEVISENKEILIKLSKM